MMRQPTLSDRQLEILRFLVARFQSDGRMAHRVGAAEIRRVEGESEDDIKKTLLYFERWGWVHWATNESVNVQDAAATFLHDLDNPNPRNHFTDWTVWWFSSRWRTAIFVITVILPLLVQWIEMIQTVLRWIGVLPAAI